MLSAGVRISRVTILDRGNQICRGSRWTLGVTGVNHRCGMQCRGDRSVPSGRPERMRWCLERVEFGRTLAAEVGKRPWVASGTGR